MTAKPPDQVTNEALEQEQMILEDIHRRTGLRFQHLASIDRNQVDVMARILPIAKEWINSGADGIRGSLYMLFLTPAASLHIDDVLAWFKAEQSPFDREVLTQVMRLVITPTTARRIWDAYKDGRPTDSEPLLLTRLVSVRSVSDEVAEYIVK